MDANEVVSRYISDDTVSCVSYRCWEAYKQCTSSAALTKVSLLTERGTLSIENINQFYDSVEALVGQLLHQVGALYDSSLPICTSSTFCKCLHATTSIEVMIFQLIGDDSPILLKDALCLPVLEQILTLPVVMLLRHLFLPQGLNFRNIIWHGFLAPHEVDIRYLHLLDVINRTLKEKLPSAVSYSLYDFASFDFAELPVVNLKHAVDKICISDLNALLDTSLIIPRNRHDVLLYGLCCYHDHKYITCMLAIIPCIEHTLRYLFCVANNTPHLLTADVDAYYSTLDGFGQRSKHQLLLDSTVYDYSNMRTSSDPAVPLRESSLPTLLGPGLYGLLIDMFFTDRGPNIRSALAHGEASMFHGNEGCAWAPATLIVAILIAMCDRFRMGTKASLPLQLSCSLSTVATVPVIAPSVQLCSTIVESWTSRYHPHTYLARQLNLLINAIANTSEVLQQRQEVSIAATRVSSGITECLLRINTASTTADAQYIEIWEKESKLNELLASRSIAPDTLNSVNTKCGSVCAVAITSLCREYMHKFLHSSPEGLSAQLITELLSFTTGHCSPTLDNSTLFDNYLNINMPLLSAYSCCVQIVKVCLEMHQVTRELILENERLIIAKMAHTSDRRRYLSLVYVLAPVVVALTTLSQCVIIRHIQLPRNDIATGILQLVLNMNASFQVCIQNIDESRASDQNKKKNPEKALAQLLTSLQSKQFLKGIRVLLSS